MEHILIIGATGNIGVAAVIAALRSNRKVLAIVRNQNSAKKLFDSVGSDKDVTTVEADITSPSGVQSVVEKVKSGQLPHFQHVYSAAGGVYTFGKLSELSNEDFRANIDLNFETNFYAYRATIPYLLEQGKDTSWTLQTGTVGEDAMFAGPAMSQGALFSMATAASRELEKTTIRFNEIRLGARVESDAVAEKTGSVPSSTYAAVYEKLLKSPEMRGGLIKVIGAEGVQNWKFEKNQGALVQY